MTMLNDYEKFLAEFDEKLAAYFEFEKDDIKCLEGCSYCCEHGDYPFSRLELEYAMSGFMKLPADIKKQIKDNFDKIKDEKDYVCPFLIKKKCSIYKYRSLTCRTHGLAYLKSDGAAKLPECANLGLNFSKTFDPETKILSREIIKENLDLPEIIKSAKGYDLEFGEIRSLVKWR
ncbi:YkgJ family cysteine cluster protein [bacterium]|nr:YkgJ family cysteine cluster protein [bacterium]